MCFLINYQRLVKIVWRMTFEYKKSRDETSRNLIGAGDPYDSRMIEKYQSRLEGQGDIQYGEGI
jgi:hypothetical protein